MFLEQGRIWTIFSVCMQTPKISTRKKIMAVLEFSIFSFSTFSFNFFHSFFSFFFFFIFDFYPLCAKKIRYQTFRSKFAQNDIRFLQKVKPVSSDTWLPVIPVLASARLIWLSADLISQYTAKILQNGLNPCGNIFVMQTIVL